jgi:S-adenosylmethionine/arginine decarboxylase-like enzyme
MIETSHIAFHIWDEPSPAILQFDLYTCGVLNQKAVLETIKSKFAVAQFDYVLLDRENGFVTEEHGFE